MFTLPQQIQDDLDQAIADRDAAAQTDDDKATADAALAAAQSTVDLAAAAGNAAHQKALASAHVVIEELTNLLNDHPPGPSPVPPVSSAKK